MEIAYCSLLLPEEKRIAERAKGYISGTSLHKFTKAVIEGMDNNLSKHATVFNIINTLNYPGFPDLLFKTERWSHDGTSQDWHIGYINLFGIKYITQSVNLYKKLYKWVKANSDDQCIICVHHIYFPSMVAAYFVKHRFKKKIKLCLITGDMTGNYGLMSQHKMNLKQRLTNIMDNYIEKLVKEYDCYVFATRDMATAYGVIDKPFTVLECAYIKTEYPEDLNEIHISRGTKIIFYAGSLRKEYGLVHLLRAFSQISDPDYRLWLAGGGNAEDIISEYQKRDSRIEFLGFLSPKEVHNRQRLATVLVSPRTAELEFVKYSFPSKTLECLASGTPYIAHRLPCDPPEYSDYIQYCLDDSDDALKNKIIEICELPLEQRKIIGKKAEEFIAREKNPTVMCKRIIKMLEIINE